MRLARFAVIASLSLALARSAPAQPAADPLDEARALERSLEYERALAIVEREIDRGAATSPARLVELHLLAGRLAAGLDRPAVAEAHFLRVLVLAPETRLPDGTSPKLTAPFEAARATAVPLHVAIERSGDRVIAHVGQDPAHIFAGVRVHLAPAREQPDVASGAGEVVAIPFGRAALTADAIDEHGNVLASANVASVELAPRVRPVYARWSTWAIASAGALAAAGLCAWRFEVDQDRWNQLEAEGGHAYSELAAIESHGRAWGIAADAGFGIAAAAGVAAIVFLATRHRDARPAVTADAAGLAVHF